MEDQCDSDGNQTNPRKRFKSNDFVNNIDNINLPVASTSRANINVTEMELPDDTQMSSPASIPESTISDSTGTTARIEIETISSDESLGDSDTEILPNILNESSDEYSPLSPFAIIVNDIHDDEVDFIEASITSRSNELSRVLNGGRSNRDLRRFLYSSSSSESSQDETMRRDRPTTSAAAARTRERRDDDEGDEAYMNDYPDLLFSNYSHASFDSEDTVELSSLEIKGIQDILNKPAPKYTWNTALELMYREQGSFGGRDISSHHSLNPIKFQNELYSSRQIVERLKLCHTLQKHHGCVNSLNFNRNGNLLCTGSDDLKIICWDWATRKPKVVFKSGHSANIFQTKFLESTNDLKIISSGRDGQVRNAIIRPSGLIVQNGLYKHTAAVHKICFRPWSTNEIYSAGEDGIVARFDLRSKNFDRIVTVRTSYKLKLRLFSIAYHPFKQQFCVCGNDQYVRVYETRNPKTPLYQMCPAELANENVQHGKHISCAIYNNTGSEILASYSSDDIYLFDNHTYMPDTYLHRYRGHNNIKTNKSVNFFGPNSEYVMSGSDCGNIFFWNKNTESIVNWVDGDRVGIVNCLETHPTIPVLATSGMENVVKIWAPSSTKYPPTMTKLEKCIKSNMKKNASEDTEYYDDRTFFYFIRQFLHERSRPTSNEPENYPTIESSTSDSEDEEDCDEELAPEIPCHPQ